MTSCTLIGLHMSHDLQQPIIVLYFRVEQLHSTLNFLYVIGSWSLVLVISWVVLVIFVVVVGSLLSYNVRRKVSILSRMSLFNLKLTAGLKEGLFFLPAIVWAILSELDPNKNVIKEVLLKIDFRIKNISLRKNGKKWYSQKLCEVVSK